MTKERAGNRNVMDTENKKTQLSDRKIVRDQIGTKTGDAYKYIVMFLIGAFALSALFGIIKKSNAVIIATSVGVLVSVIALYFISRPIRACIKAMREGKFSVVVDTVKDIIVSPDDNQTYIIEFAASEMIYQSPNPMEKGDTAYLIIAITDKGFYSCANYYPTSRYEYIGEKEVIIGNAAEQA